MDSYFNLKNNFPLKILFSSPTLSINHFNEERSKKIKYIDCGLIVSSIKAIINKNMESKYII